MKLFWLHHSKFLIPTAWKLKHRIFHGLDIFQKYSSGAKVYVTGRNETTLKVTCDQIGVNAVPTVCDHAQDDQVKELFRKIKEENNGRLDFLVNNCFSAVTLLIGKEENSANKFWEADPSMWDDVSFFK